VERECNSSHYETLLTATPTPRPTDHENKEQYMATKKQIIEFIDGAYGDNEELVWQAVSLGDIRHYLADRNIDISVNEWNEFVDYTERYSVLADTYTENAIDQVIDYKESN
jgi:hypothetical protein